MSHRVIFFDDQPFASENVFFRNLLQRGLSAYSGWLVELAKTVGGL